MPPADSILENEFVRECKQESTNMPVLFPQITPPSLTFHPPLVHTGYFAHAWFDTNTKKHNTKKRYHLFIYLFSGASLPPRNSYPPGQLGNLAETGETASVLHLTLPRYAAKHACRFRPPLSTENVNTFRRWREFLNTPQTAIDRHKQFARGRDVTHLMPIEL